LVSALQQIRFQVKPTTHNNMVQLTNMKTFYTCI